MEFKATNSTETPSGFGCYLYGVLFPIGYFLTVPRERQHPFLRFHCFQCLLLVPLFIPLTYWADKYSSSVASVGFLVVFGAWFVALIQAGRRKKFKLPLLGIIAERLSSGSAAPSA